MGCLTEYTNSSCLCENLVIHSKNIGTPIISRIILGIKIYNKQKQQKVPVLMDSIWGRRSEN